MMQLSGLRSRSAREISPAMLFSQPRRLARPVSGSVAASCSSFSNRSSMSEVAAAAAAWRGPPNC
jgi:hypothetical protein